MGMIAAISGREALILSVVWCTFFLLILLVAARKTPTVYWGRFGVGAPMSRVSRVVIVTTVWLMISMILAGVTGAVAVPKVGVPWMVGVFLTFVMSAVDTWRWKREGGGTKKEDEKIGGA
jgi:hypothetical protein